VRGAPVRGDDAIGDLGPYFSQGKLDLRFELDYDPSRTLAPFTADVGLEFSVVVTADGQKLF
jgi:hypothetical protein